MINTLSLVKFLTFFVLIITGFSLEALFSKLYYKLTNNPYKNHHYSFSKYLYFIILPILIIIYFVHGSSLNFIAVFLGFSLFGTLAEWIIGFFYHKIVGQRLWTYHKYAIFNYTSFLSIPMWGLAGLIFYLFIQIFIL